MTSTKAPRPIPPRRPLKEMQSSVLKRANPRSPTEEAYLHPEKVWDTLQALLGLHYLRYDSHRRKELLSLVCNT